MMKDIILICKSVWYYSQVDEDMFFDWLAKIPSILRFDGQADELYLYCKSKKIAAEDLRELLAMFYRYKIEMKQLQIFLNKDNKKWFYDNTKAYWHKRVFGSNKK